MDEGAIEAARRVAATLDGLDARVDPSLAGGAAGLAVCFAHLAAVTADDGDLQAADRYLELALDQAWTQVSSYGIGLFGGLTGVAWAELEVGRALGRPTVPDADLDAFLAEILDRRPWSGPWDVVSGLAGIGAYALARPPGTPPDLVASVVAALDATLTGLEWLTDTAATFGSRRGGRPAYYTDLGLAHGLPGAVAFLAGAVQAGSEEARPALTAAVARLLAHELAAEVPDSRYPSGAGDGMPPKPSRLAWCYGDLGVAAALWGAGVASKDEGATAAAWRALRAAASRPPRTTGVQDAALCHGTAGVALLFHQLAVATGDATVAEAGRRWGDRLAGEVDRGSLPQSGGLLEGRAGVVLALVALAGGDDGWSAMLVPGITPAGVGAR